MPAESAKPALEQLGYGLYVIGSKNTDEVNGMTANWLTQVSFDPRLVALAIEQQAHTLANIRATKVFSVNLIAEDGQQLIEKFVEPQQRVGDKLGDVSFRIGVTGCPILDDAVAWFECEVDQYLAAGDHELVIGRVVDGGELRADAEPLTLRAMGWSYGG